MKVNRVLKQSQEIMSKEQKTRKWWYRKEIKNLTSPHWEVWLGSQKSWDIIVNEKIDKNIFQTYNWGTYSKINGWKVLRLITYENNKVSGLVQVLYKKIIPGIGVVWVPGGPVGSIKNWNKNLRQIIKKELRFFVTYIRIFPMRKFCNEDVTILKHNSWFKAEPTLYSGDSLYYSPRIGEDERLMHTRKNWRHNLRRFKKNRNIITKIWFSPDTNEILSLYQEMENYKNISQQFSLQQIKSIIELFPHNCLIVRCEDMNGNTLALRGALLLGEKGWDIFAVTGSKARKNYSSYGIFWELMKQCNLKGVEWYDMSGVDAKNNKGVFNFKQGTGAKEYKYLGEWDWSELKIVLKIFRFAIRFKISILEIYLNLKGKTKKAKKNNVYSKLS